MCFDSGESKMRKKIFVIFFTQSQFMKIILLEELDSLIMKYYIEFTHKKNL